MRFGSREIVDVVFKAAANNQKVGNKVFKRYQPVFMIETARTSTLEQQTATAYAQGGQGYSRLIAWEGEKTITFTVEDALMSPMGMAVLTGAGLIKADETKGNSAHVHCTINVTTDADGNAEVTLEDLKNETYLTDPNISGMKICTLANEMEIFGTVLDGSGAGIEAVDGITINGASSEYYEVTKNNPAIFSTGKPKTTIQLDFYLVMSKGVTTIEIKPQDFGGYFYVEAQTLYRREDNGQDMAAELIFPRVKVQSAFTLTMAANGDPSTFSFVMDAFPGYTRFDKTRKTMVDMQIIGDDTGASEEVGHNHEVAKGDTPTVTDPNP